MDYLATPKISRLSRVIVPYLPGFSLDDDEFSSYPCRAGCRHKQTLDITLPARKLASLAQEWLFFGLIDGLLGCSVERSRFISSDGQSIDATAFQAIMTQVTLELRSADSQGRIKTIQHRLRTAVAASKRLERVVTDDEPSIAVFLSIRILTDFLSGFIDTGLLAGDFYSLTTTPLASTRAPHVTVLEDASVKLDELTPVQRLLFNRLKGNGWCHSQIITVFCRTEHLMVYYLSFLDRDEGPDINHGSCTYLLCKAYNTSASTKSARHVVDGCQCALISLPEKELVRIIESDKIPLACSTFSDAQYTAMSHVWIDGMGNPEKNALPTCRLTRIAKSLSSHDQPGEKSIQTLKRSPLFWMDTLCIPVSPQYANIRQKAISKMALIYTAAAQVLVVDRDLENMSISERSTAELTAWTATSKWNTRCWTLQEGVLARNCLFQFKDTVLPITVEDRFEQDMKMFAHDKPFWYGPVIGVYWFGERLGWTTIAAGNRWIDGPPINHATVANGGLFYGTEPAENITKDLIYRALRLATGSVSAQRRPLERFRHNAAPPSPEVKYLRLLDIWNLLGRRHTTKAEDLPDIIANLTDVRASRLRDFDESVDRIKVILNCMDTFPAEIMYKDYPRPRAGKNSADRWIPSSPGPEQVFGDARVSPKPDGLLVHSGTWPTSRVLKSGILLTEPGAMLLSTFRIRMTREKIKFEVTLNCLLPKQDEFLRNEGQQACLMLDIHVPKVQGKLGQITDEALVRGARLLLLLSSELGKKHGTVRARFDCPLRGVARVCKEEQTAPTVVVQPPLIASRELPPVCDTFIEQSLDERVLKACTNGGKDVNISRYPEKRPIMRQLKFGSTNLTVLVGLIMILKAKYSCGLQRPVLLRLADVIGMSGSFVLVHVMRFISYLEEVDMLNRRKAMFEEGLMRGQLIGSWWVKLSLILLPNVMLALALVTSIFLGTLVFDWDKGFMREWTYYSYISPGPGDYVGRCHR
ncbi:hypothetical protein BN1708_008477 [Verticillium longisporum]|uniref:Heterokaryon incompatibility domain-containing protein n=1 Tax=Verticillium longisporum TaxID=100787 RepID=A0A0G4N3N6_VERLO|nr:hypothetical protein BN1708_008477 [Verticillium longisporum]